MNQDARDLPKHFYLNRFIKTDQNHIYNYDQSPKQEDSINKHPIQIDKVLVDVECSHDGSLKHMLKYFTSKSKFRKKKSDSKPLFVLSNREKKRRAKQAKLSKNKPKSIL